MKQSGEYSDLITHKVCPFCSEKLTLPLKSGTCPKCKKHLVVRCEHPDCGTFLSIATPICPNCQTTRRIPKALEPAFLDDTLSDALEWLQNENLGSLHGITATLIADALKKDLRVYKIYALISAISKSHDVPPTIKVWLRNHLEATLGPRDWQNWEKALLQPRLLGMLAEKRRRYPKKTVAECAELVLADSTALNELDGRVRTGYERFIGRKYKGARTDHVARLIEWWNGEPGRTFRGKLGNAR